MNSAMALVGMVLKVVVLGLAFAFTIETSKGDGVALKVAKFLGLLISIVPILGLVMYVATRGKKSRYGERCGAMALAGLVTYVVLQKL